MTTMATASKSKAPAVVLTLREEQRAMTRKRLLDAARTVFQEKNYLVATVDDIAAQARVSRATFYLHYTGKDDVLSDLLAEDIEHQEILFRRLAAVKEPDEAALTTWIEHYLGKARRSSRKAQTLALAVALDPSWYRRFSEHRDRLIAILGEGIPAFRLPAKPTPASEERRIGAHLLLFQLEQLCAQAALDVGALDYRLGCRVLARNFRNVIAGINIS
jgi:TetR/AcrR family transcriptional regulator, ethionamide resistance regulator